MSLGLRTCDLLACSSRFSIFLTKRHRTLAISVFIWSDGMQEHQKVDSYPKAIEEQLNAPIRVRPVFPDSTLRVS
jgi:hypothetical protein